jgi:hypothetical protein
VTGAQAYAFTSIDLSVVRTTLYTPWAPAPGEPTTPQPVPPSRAARQADALFVAFDTDQDGSITKDEFTESARDFLRRARDVHRPDRAEGGHHRDHESRGVHRLERRLEHLFDRVDTDGDGAATRDELLAGLERRGQRGEPSGLTPSVPPAAPTGQDPTAVPGAGVVSFVSVTHVEVAIRRYSVVEQLAPPLPSETSSNLTSDLAPRPAA